MLTLWQYVSSLPWRRGPSSWAVRHCSWPVMCEIGDPSSIRDTVLPAASSPSILIIATTCPYSAHANHDPTDMAQHPEMYSADELAKSVLPSPTSSSPRNPPTNYPPPHRFAANTSSRPTEIHGSHVDSPAPPYATSPALTNTSFNSPHASPEPLQQECHELEARDRDRNLDEKVAREREYQRQVAAAASAGGGVAVPPAPAGGALPTRERPTTTLRQRMADFEEEEEEEDGDEVGGGAWAYSGEAVRVAPAARVVQVGVPRPPVGSILSLYT